MKIKYSFIIPHKNSEIYLNRCVNSIPNRSDVEIIIVDDNSSVNQKPHFDQDNIKIIYLNSMESKGAGHARNVGLSEIKGEWVLFPDCDDYYEDGFLEKLNSFDSSDIDVVYFNSLFRDGETGEILPHNPLYYDFENYDGSIASIDAVKFHHNAPWTKMVSKKYIRRYGFCFEETRNGNDLFFSMCIGYCTNRIEIIKQPLYSYMKNKNSITNKVLSPKEALCLINHTIQANKFYKFLNREEWCLPIIMPLLRFFKTCGLSFFLLFVLKIPYVIRHSNDLIKLVTSLNKEESAKQSLMVV